MPLDGSQLAECVLPHLRTLARASAAQVTFLRVLERQETERGSRIDPVDWHIQKAEAEAYIDSVVERYGDGLAPQKAVLEGKAGESVLEYARTNGVDLILLSSHGRSGLTGWNVSSVVQKIILRNSASTMIVRAYQPSAAGGQEVRYRKILVPLDGSQRAECVLPLVAALGRQDESSILVAHVIRRPEMPRRSPLTDPDIELADRVTERNRQEGEKYLEQLKARLTGIETRLIVSNGVCGPLHTLAAEEQVDLVVVSAHGYSGETRWPYGSTVISFVTYGTSPLLIVQDSPSRISDRNRSRGADHIGRPATESEIPV